MKNMDSLFSIKKEITLLIRYGAPEEHQDDLLQLIDHYENDIIALRLLHHFYSFLPDAREEAIVSLRILARRQGKFLLCTITHDSAYLYLVTSDRAEFTGTLAEGLWDVAVLDFFGFNGRDDFLKRFQEWDDLPIHEPTPLDQLLCPACLVEHGDLHILGCPVEICPWCDGQLTNCECRFIQLNKEKLAAESHIEALLEKLAEKGRLPFDAENHRPNYPVPEKLLKNN